MRGGDLRGEPLRVYLKLASPGETVHRAGNSYGVLTGDIERNPQKGSIYCSYGRFDQSL